LSAVAPSPRANGRNPLPEGTLYVGAGLIVAGLSAYAFLSITARMLGKEDFVPVSQLWFATFVLAPGFFLPVEQEVGRALAHRRALAQGGLPVIRKAGILAVGLVAIISLVLIIASPVLVDQVFHGSWPLFSALILAFCSYALAHFTRGVSSGSGRFGPYGFLMGSEGVIRVVACVTVAALGVESAGAYGLLVGLPALIAVAITVPRLARHNPVLTEGPDADWAELTPNLGWLLAGSALAAVLLNAGPLAANLLADESEKELVSSFAYGVLIARVPLFLFQAVQAALLPKLARLAARGALGEFRRGFRKLMKVVIAVGAIGTVGAFLVGPFAVKVFFGEDLGRRTLTLLAIASALYMVAVAMAQALIALHGHARVAMSWALGMVAFLVVTAIAGDDLLLRVELGLVAGSTAAVIAFALNLRLKMRRAPSDRTVTEGQLLEAFYDIQVEP